MRLIDKIFFARLTLPPEGQRAGLLEYAGATALGDDRLESAINPFTANLRKRPVTVNNQPN